MVMRLMREDELLRLFWVGRGEKKKRRR